MRGVYHPLPEPPKSYLPKVACRGSLANSPERLRYDGVLPRTRPLLPPREASKLARHLILIPVELSTDAIDLHEPAKVGPSQFGSGQVRLGQSSYVGLGWGGSVQVGSGWVGVGQGWTGHGCMRVCVPGWVHRLFCVRLGVNICRTFAKLSLSHVWALFTHLRSKACVSVWVCLWVWLRLKQVVSSQ